MIFFVRRYFWSTPKRGFELAFEFAVDEDRTSGKFWWSVDRQAVSSAATEQKYTKDEQERGASHHRGLPQYLKNGGSFQPGAQYGCPVAPQVRARCPANVLLLGPVGAH